ncbi:MAG: IS21 family transposase, partial [Gammaproteobacteria bacterium]
MISDEQVARIRHLFHAEHWKIGTLAAELGLHPETIRAALNTDRFRSHPRFRAILTDPYLDFLRQTLQQYPRLRATRLFQMIRPRGYTGSVSQLRRVVADLRPSRREAFLHLRTFPGEQAQADWAHFGEVSIGHARRHLSGFVLTLSYSRALWLEFFLDQSLENFLLGHVHAFSDWGGAPRTVLVDNLKSVVLERCGDAIHFHPRFLELSAHYHFATRPCHPARGNEKGRVERAIQFARHSFFAARSFTTLADFNRQALAWRDQIAHVRPWPGDDSRSVAQVFEEEKPRLLPLPAHPFSGDLMRTVYADKTLCVRFDLNDYSVPPRALGRALTLVASPTTVRLLDGSTEIASHRRSYDRHEQVEDPAHRQALLEQKRKALGSTASGRLAALVPESQAFLQAAFEHGESATHLTAQLLRLLDDYGAAELAAALREALDRQTPRLSSVAFILARRHRQQQRCTPLPVNLSRRPDLENLTVSNPSLEAYDELSQNPKNSDDER